MKKNLTLSLDEQTYDRLLALCQGDEEAMARRAEEIIQQHVASRPAPETGLNTEGLEGFLQSSPSGSRAYGVKGQGW